METSANRYQDAAKEYTPPKTLVLFIAEAPPLSSDRYFYFEKVERGDWLWIALMKALYEPGWKGAREERARKPYWLRRFQSDGFLLIDAVKQPISGTGRQRIARISSDARQLIREVKKIDPKQIVLIKTTVYHALFQRFKEAGLPVINDGPLPFPSSGQAKNFAEGFRKLMPQVKNACENAVDLGFHPVGIPGEPLSATIIRERRSTSR